MSAFSRDVLAEAASGQGVRTVPAAVHAENCAYLLARYADRPDMADIVGALGLDATPPPAAKERTGEHHYHGTLLPPTHRIGAML